MRQPDPATSTAVLALGPAPVTLLPASTAGARSAAAAAVDNRARTGGWAYQSDAHEGARARHSVNRTCAWGAS
ncbi:hypothetical protein [Actinacidiphila sp. bgisy160]|uniref:hypothetical protein n=1 Tax=Actinacidiphila sp. bgisy160 TaxID=3413796 RepID=UPI003D725C4E